MVQFSLRIWTVWEGPFVLMDRFYGIHWLCKRTAKALIRLRECTLIWAFVPRIWCKDHFLEYHVIIPCYHFIIQSTLVIEFQGTLWNTSRYPYLEISDLQNWGKIFAQPHLTNIYNCTLEVRDILKILWKRGEIAEQFLLFSTIFLPVIRFSCLGSDQIFTSRKAVIRGKRGLDNGSQLYWSIYETAVLYEWQLSLFLCFPWQPIGDFRNASAIYCLRCYPSLLKRSQI